MATQDFDHLEENFKNFLKESNITNVEAFECPILPDTWLPKSQTDPTAVRTPQIWLHGLGAVFLVSICAIFGAFILAGVQKYQHVSNFVMLYLMSLAVSALSGAAIMVLIPEGLGLHACAHHTPNLTVCIGIISCFLIHQLIRELTVGDTEGGHSHGHGDYQAAASNQNSESNMFNTENMKNTRPLIENLKNLKPVGWLCLVGDGIHNFLDGIAIGASFSLKGINMGWQVTIAILAEEFPHELGDVAILINSGLNFTQAIICNLFSAATCLAGFFLGMYFGEQLHLFVFAWMGGIFLFISLTGMLPEVDETIISMNKKYKSFGKLSEYSVHLVALLGLLTGYFLVYQCGSIDFEGITNDILE